MLRQAIVVFNLLAPFVMKTITAILVVFCATMVVFTATAPAPSSTAATIIAAMERKETQER